MDENVVAIRFNVAGQEGQKPWKQLPIGGVGLELL